MAVTISGSGTSGGFSSAGAFNTSPAASGYFIPTLWSGKLNVKFYSTTVFGEIANTAYEGEIKSIGDKVIINNIPSMTINDYQVGQTLSYEVPTPSKVELLIDKAKYFGVNISDVIEYQSQPKLMDMFTSDAAKQMSIAIDTLVLKNSVDTLYGWTKADTPSTTGAGINAGTLAGVRSSSFNLGGAGGTYNASTNPFGGVPLTLSSSNILSTITALASVLDEQNVPDTDRWLVITPAARNLLMNSNLQQAYLTGDSQSVLRNGKIGTIDRFSIYVSNLLPTASAGQNFDGTTTGTGISANAVARKCMIAGAKSAITFASQIAKVESLPNPGDFGTLVRGLNVFGFKTLKPEAMAMAQYL
jgi:hypothetical protein